MNSWRERKGSITPSNLDGQLPYIFVTCLCLIYLINGFIRMSVFSWAFGLLLSLDFKVWWDALVTLKKKIIRRSSHTSLPNSWRGCKIGLKRILQMVLLIENKVICSLTASCSNSATGNRLYPSKVSFPTKSLGQVVLVGVQRWCKCLFDHCLGGI